MAPSALLTADSSRDNDSLRTLAVCTSRSYFSLTAKQEARASYRGRASSSRALLSVRSGKGDRHQGQEDRPFSGARSKASRACISPERLRTVSASKSRGGGA